MNVAERVLAYFDRTGEAPDAVGRLRRFILDLAVRGKLVEQDASDEPAAELLGRIANSEAQLAKSGEIRHDNPIDPVGDDADFDVPPNWRWTRLGRVTSYIQRGKSPKYAASDGALVVSQRCVQWRGLDLAVARRVTWESLAEYEEVRFLREGDLLWNSTGTGTIGRVVRVVDPPKKLVCDSHVTIVRCLEVNPEYVRTWLRSDYVYSLIEGRARGATNQVELTAQIATNQVIPLPPLPEQQRIVAKVDELMALCDRLESAEKERESRRDRLVGASLGRLNTPDATTFQSDARFALDALPALTARRDQIVKFRESVLSLAVHGRLVPQDAGEEPAPAFVVPVSAGREDRIAASLPSGWSWARVRDVAEARLGKMLDRAKNAGRLRRYLRNTNVHWFNIRMDALKELRIEDDEIAKYELQTGDVLICEGGHGIGRTAVWRGSEEGVLYQKALHRVRPGPALDSDFFSYCVFVYFHAGVLRSYFTGVGIPHFTGKALAELVFPLAPLAEQRRIVRKVDEVMAVCDRLEALLLAGRTVQGALLEVTLRNALADREPTPMIAAR